MIEEVIRMTTANEVAALICKIRRTVVERGMLTEAETDEMVDHILGGLQADNAEVHSEVREALGAAECRM